MKNILLLPEKADIIAHVRGLWRTAEFRRSHDAGGLVARIAERFARLPRFFYGMSDECLERAHFSVWWSGVAYRSYGKDSCHDLYLLHELAHGADMTHMAGQDCESFRRKMQDDEFYASTVTEIMAYFDMPSLRALSFPNEIFADRFLKDPAMHARWREDPERLTAELCYRRRHAMLHPDRNDPMEMWLHGFTAQNDRWFDIWRGNANAVEQAMERLARLSAVGKRREALARHMDWLAQESENGVPFRAEAEAFAKVYWKDREKPKAAA